MKGLFKFLLITIIMVTLVSALFLVAILGEQKELPLDIQQTIDPNLTFNTYLNQITISKDLAITEQEINSILLNEIANNHNEFYELNYLYVDLIEEHTVKFYSNISLNTNFFILDHVSTDFSGTINFSFDESKLVLAADDLTLGRLTIPNWLLTALIQGDDQVTRSSDYGEMTFYTTDLKMAIAPLAIDGYNIQKLLINDNAFNISIGDQ